MAVVAPLLYTARAADFHFVRRDGGISARPPFSLSSPPFHSDVMEFRVMRVGEGREGGGETWRGGVEMARRRKTNVGRGYC